MTLRREFSRAAMGPDRRKARGWHLRAADGRWLGDQPRGSRVVYPLPPDANRSSTSHTARPKGRAVAESGHSKGQRGIARTTTCCSPLSWCRWRGCAVVRVRSRRRSAEEGGDLRREKVGFFGRCEVSARRHVGESCDVVDAFDPLARQDAFVGVAVVEVCDPGRDRDP